MMSKMLVLDRLLHRKESSSFILIEDTANCSGWPLLREFIVRAISDGRNVILLCTEVEPNTLLGNVPLTQNFHILDAYTNSLNWDNDLSPETNPNLHMIRCISNFKLIFSEIERISNKLKSLDTLIAIDSVQPLQAHSVLQTYHLLKRLESLTPETRLVALHHLDLPLPTQPHIPSPTKSLETFASAILNVRGKILEDTMEEKLLCVAANKPLSEVSVDVVVWKRNGKYLKETNDYKPTLTKEPPFLEIMPLKDTKSTFDGFSKLSVEEPTSQQSDPTANLPFNLGLTPLQRTARENVILPYLKVDESQVSTARTTGGTIYYAPDAADDFDEEDPDEDLVI